MPSAPDIDTNTRYPLSIPCQMFLFPFFNLLMWIVFLLLFFTASKEWFFLLLYTLPLLDQRGNFSRLGWKQGSPHLGRLWEKKRINIGQKVDDNYTTVMGEIFEAPACLLLTAQSITWSMFTFFICTSQREKCRSHVRKREDYLHVLILFWLS